MYAEYYKWGLSKWPYLNQGSHKKNNYYLLERAIINDKEKLILSFKPELFISKIFSYKLNRKSINLLYDSLMRWGLFPTRLVRYSLYLVAQLPILGNYLTLKYLLSQKKRHLIRYSKLDKNMQEKSIAYDSKALSSVKNKRSIKNLIIKIFAFDHQSLPKKNIIKFIDLIN